MLPFLAPGVRRISGSILYFFFFQESCKSTAGLFREKEGIMENPLLVRPREPEKAVAFWVVSCCCVMVSCWASPYRGKKDTAISIMAYLILSMVINLRVAACSLLFDTQRSFYFFAQRLYRLPFLLPLLQMQRGGQNSISKVIGLAKEKVFDISKSISEIAYDLGFKYPRHFTRFFKQQVGLSPNEYRLLNI